MYKREYNKKDNNNRAIAQKNSNINQGVIFVDNRSNFVVQRNIQDIANNNQRVKQFITFQKSGDCLYKQRTIQFNVISGQADQHDWNAKHVHKHVKDWATRANVRLKKDYEGTLKYLASDEWNSGDGILTYLNNWFHKRFGQYCILYLWVKRRDEKGVFINVKGIGRKNGSGNDYALIT